MINDDLFGKLEYKNNFWRGKTTIRMFDLEKEILLSIDSHESADFSNVQSEAFIELRVGFCLLVSGVLSRGTGVVFTLAS